MALYIHAPGDMQSDADKARLRQLPRTTQSAEAAQGQLQRIVRILTRTDALVVPDAVDRCDALMERIKAIARLMEIPVVPLQVFQGMYRSAAAYAEPQTRQRAASGPNPLRP